MGGEWLAAAGLFCSVPPCGFVFVFLFFLGAFPRSVIGRLELRELVVIIILLLLLLDVLVVVDDDDDV